MKLQIYELNGSLMPFCVCDHDDYENIGAEVGRFKIRADAELFICAKTMRAAKLESDFGNAAQSAYRKLCRQADLDANRPAEAEGVIPGLELDRVAASMKQLDEVTFEIDQGEPTEFVDHRFRQPLSEYQMKTLRSQALEQIITKIYWGEFRQVELLAMPTMPAEEVAREDAEPLPEPTIIHKEQFKKADEARPIFAIHWRIKPTACGKDFSPHEEVASQLDATIGVDVASGKDFSATHEIDWSQVPEESRKILESMRSRPMMAIEDVARELDMPEPTIIHKPQ